jgi:hypothetical protein
MPDQKTADQRAAEAKIARVRAGVEYLGTDARPPKGSQPDDPISKARRKLEEMLRDPRPLT